MLKVAIYGKGGIGKSTTCANLAYALALQGHKVLQIGCDPKADSTLALHPGQKLTPVLELLRQNPKLKLEEAIFQGQEGVYCLETGGPVPGLGCAGRAIGMVLEYLKQQRVLEVLELDCVIYDVLGDVVCGGFAQPMRQGYAKQVLIVSSTEPMSLYAAQNISQAVLNFKNRGYASLGGFIANGRRENLDLKPLKNLAKELNTPLWAQIPYSQEILDSEKQGQTLLKTYPSSKLAKIYEDLARELYAKLA